MVQRFKENNLYLSLFPDTYIFKHLQSDSLHILFIAAMLHCVLSFIFGSVICSHMYSVYINIQADLFVGL